MITAVNPVGRVKYIPESERGAKKKKPTAFYYLPLNEGEKLDVVMQVQANNGALPASVVSSMVQGHIVAWENFNEKNGDPVEFSQVAAMTRIPWEVQLEIATEIVEATGFIKIKAKN